MNAQPEPTRSKVLFIDSPTAGNPLFDADGPNVVQHAPRQPYTARMPIPEPSEYPATKAAFTFVGPSYQLLASRFEAADSRITSMVTFASTLTFSGATLAKAINPAIDYNAQWFYIALGAYIFSIVFGIAGRLQGSLALPDPAVHHRESLWRSEESFQAAAIYWAGEHLAANRQAIIVKANYGYAVMAFTVAEVFSLIFWIRG